ncbi:MAG: ABC transporter ATP-binding protein [Sporolactobacillus sp.]|jgi:peptide/nickel transport system ATP-binding protein|nr:ABC transporter ATP-binding protein [Sporolactobacillus sp.]
MRAVKDILMVENLGVTLATKQGAIEPVRQVTFKVQKGETVGIVGESGCGKSITSLTIMGLLPKKQGKIKTGKIIFKGQDITSYHEKKMRQLRGNEMSMIFQEPMVALNPVFTIGDQLSQPLIVHTNLKKSAINRKVIEILRLVGIPRAEKIVHQYPFELSGGMRQRIMICLAIICKPDLLIADEPTTALDVTIQAQILDLLQKIKAENEMSVIFISHDLGVVAEICDRVIVMYAGQIVEQASAEEFFDHPIHPYSKGLLESLPTEDERKGHLKTIPGHVPNPSQIPDGCPFSNRCPFVFDLCRKKAPPVIQLANRSFRCWLYSGTKEDLNGTK